MIVKLLAYTPNADRGCAAAARSCYSENPSGTLVETMKNPAKMLSAVVAMGHHSVLEHAAFTFSIEGVSRSLTHQLVRHRVASYSQQSQRYVSINEPTYVIPDTIKQNPEACKLYEDLMIKIWDTYGKLEDLGILAEDARYVLPNGCTTNTTVTMNAPYTEGGEPEPQQMNVDEVSGSKLVLSTRMTETTQMGEQVATLENVVKVYFEKM